MEVKLQQVGPVSQQTDSIMCMCASAWHTAWVLPPAGASQRSYSFLLAIRRDMIQYYGNKLLAPLNISLKGGAAEFRQGTAPDRPGIAALAYTYTPGYTVYNK